MKMLSNNKLFLLTTVFCYFVVEGVGVAQPPAKKPATAPVAQAAPAAATPAAAPLTSDREIYIDAGRAGVRKLRFAIPSFSFTANPAGGAKVSPSDKDQYAQRLGELLAFTGYVEVMSPTGFVAKNDPASRPPKFDEWTAINSEMLIFSKLEADLKGKLTAEFSLYDVRKQKRLLGKSYSGIDKKEIDIIIRRFADLCVEALTGQLGIFSTKLAFVGSRVEGQPRQLFISNFDGSGLQQITDNNAITMSPSWSADGTKLAYTSFKDGRANIYVYNLLTKRTTQLTHGPGNNSGANWFPDGSHIVFSGSVKGMTSIFTMNATNGSDRKQIISSASGVDVEPAYSPDGSKLAFASGRFHRPHLFVRDLTTGLDTRITFAGWYNSSPAWRPDGKKLAFAGYDKEIDRYDIFIVNPDGRQMERLTLEQGDNEKPAWSADGRFIIWQSNRTGVRGRKGTHKIHVMTGDGAEQRALNIPLVDAAMPSWGPRINELGN